ncbi:hypothetical protein [Chondromyces apiculatus]|uniref:Transmembrane protein n=1 Tax=Chondromyces apiculatus DSM 436 TaxID=1192034 RepID=A0A017T6D8_9BACT|nr:hypothetical protein [Chondromyces apiculatus]EYF04547.1 Hypothetical protein CAP_4367 [Chondromyces apiculatus DSM 436]
MQPLAHPRSPLTADPFPSQDAPSLSSPSLLAPPSPTLAPPSHRAHVALPFAVLGAAGGWMAADFFRVGALEHMDAGLRPALVAITPLTALLLGVVLQPVTRWPAARAAVATVVSVLSAAIFAGAFVGAMTWAKDGVGTGAASGFWCGVAFLPGFGAVLAASRRVGRARAGSLVDGADRRTVWLAVAVTIALGTLAALPDWTLLPGKGMPALGVSRALGILAVTTTGIVALWNAAALFRALRATQKLRTMRACAPDDPNLVWAQRQLDFGLGYQAAASVLPAGGIYREHDRFTAVIRGDASLAGRALFGALALAGAALVCGQGCLLATLSGTSSRMATAAWLEDSATALDLSRPVTGIPVAE